MLTHQKASNLLQEWGEDLDNRGERDTDVRLGTMLCLALVLVSELYHKIDDMDRALRLGLDELERKAK